MSYYEMIIWNQETRFWVFGDVDTEREREREREREGERERGRERERKRERKKERERITIGELEVLWGNRVVGEEREY